MDKTNYPAPGAPELARRVGELLQEAGVAYGERPERGWDHGVWILMLGLTRTRMCRCCRSRCRVRIRQP